MQTNHKAFAWARDVARGKTLVQLVSLMEAKLARANLVRARAHELKDHVMQAAADWHLACARELEKLVFRAP